MSKIRTQFEKFTKTWKKKAEVEVRRATIELRRTARAANKAFTRAKTDAFKTRATIARRSEAFFGDFIAAASAVARQPRKTASKRAARKSSTRTSSTART